MGIRQRVEILKALYRGVDVLILDEPTTNLAPQEVDSLFHSLRAMVEEGMSVVFITHKLREVLSVSDRISVLREGKNVFTIPRAQANEEALVKGMVGAGLDVEQSLLFSGTGLDEESLQVGEKPMLTVQDLRVTGPSGNPRVESCSFDILDGEILGLAGVAGNGQQALAEAILGICEVDAGAISLDATDLAGLSTEERLAAGITYIPEDRLHDGYLPTANVAQNLILGFQHQEPYSRGRFLDWKAIYRAAKALIFEYNIMTPDANEVAGNLSGGNIQRVMLARAFSRAAKLLVAHNPTQGLDIKSMEFVYSKLLECKRQGMATLLIADDLDELLLLSDRIATIYRGRIVGILDRSAFDKYEIGQMMMGVKGDE
jgi:simple sugar transport system ATP-binding protein